MKIFSSYSNITSFYGTDDTKKTEGTPGSTVPMINGKNVSSEGQSTGDVGDKFESLYPVEEEKKAAERLKHLITFSYNYEKGLEKLSESDRKAATTDFIRNKMQQINKWTSFITRPANGIRTPEKVVIFEAAMQDAQEDGNSGPLVLDENAVMTVLDQYRKTDDKDSFDFHKEYRKKLREPYLKNVPEKGDTWVVVKTTSKSKDNTNYNKNLRKLNILSRENWETSSDGADQYLMDGDFNILYRNGEPVVGMKTKDGKVTSILGKSAESDNIPLSTLDAIREYCDKNNLTPTNGTEEQLSYAEERKNFIYGDKENGIVGFKEIVDEADDGAEEGCYSIEKTEKILEAMSILSERDGNGHLIISNYGIPAMLAGEIKETGLDENKLFKNISAIRGSANFSYSTVTNLGILERIGGNAVFGDSQLETLGDPNDKTKGQLKSIGGNADFSNSKLKTLGTLEYIGKDAIFSNSKLEDTGELRYVGGLANYSKSELASTCKLERANDIDFSKSNVRNAKSVKNVPGNIVIDLSMLTNKDVEHIENPRNTGWQKFWRRILNV